MAQGTPFRASASSVPLFPYRMTAWDGRVSVSRLPAASHSSILVSVVLPAKPQRLASNAPEVDEGEDGEADLLEMAEDARDAGLLDDAHELYCQLLAARRVRLGSTHAETIAIMDKLGAIIFLLGDPKGASELLLEALAANRAGWCVRASGACLAVASYHASAVRERMSRFRSSVCAARRLCAVEVCLGSLALFPESGRRGEAQAQPSGDVSLY